MATKIKSGIRRLEIDGQGGGSVKLFYDNIGEPYREGVAFDVQSEDDWVRVLMDVNDVRKMRNKLNEFLGEK